MEAIFWLDGQGYNIYIPSYRSWRFPGYWVPHCPEETPPDLNQKSPVKNSGSKMGYNIWLTAGVLWRTAKG